MTDYPELPAEKGPTNTYRVTGIPGLRFLYLAVSIWRHLKRGTTYTVILKAGVQGELHEGDVAVIYADHKTLGNFWARKFEEFHDGRFVREDKDA